MVRKSELDSKEVSRLKEIQQEMLALLDEAESIVVEHASAQASLRAKYYWIPHIKCALVKEHEYLGGSMYTMEETIEEMPRLPISGSDSGRCIGISDSED